MFKFIFIISMLLPTVSANEIGVNALSDLNFVELSVTEIDQTDELDFDSSALIPHTIIQFPHDKYIKLSYFTPFIFQSYFQGFHSRAPPRFILPDTFIT